MADEATAARRRAIARSRSTTSWSAGRGTRRSTRTSSGQRLGRARARRRATGRGCRAARSARRCTCRSWRRARRAAWSACSTWRRCRPSAFTEDDEQNLEVLADADRRAAAAAVGAHPRRAAQDGADGRVDGRRAHHDRRQPARCSSSTRRRARMLGARPRRASAVTAKYLKEKLGFYPVRSGARRRRPRSRCARSSRSATASCTRSSRRCSTAAARRSAWSWCCATSPSSKALDQRKEEFVSHRLARAAHAADVDHRRARHRAQAVRRAGSPTSSRATSRWRATRAQQAQRASSTICSTWPRSSAASCRCAWARSIWRSWRATRSSASAPPASRSSIAARRARAAERGAHRRRRRPPDAGAQQPAVQRDQVHARGRAHRGRHLRPARSRARFVGLSVWNNGDSIAEERPRARVRQVRADPVVEHAQGRRHRPRPGDLARHRRGARRAHLGRGRRAEGHALRVHAARHAARRAPRRRADAEARAASPRAQRRPGRRRRSLHHLHLQGHAGRRPATACTWRTTATRRSASRARRSPTSITVDLRMPGVDGLALVEILKHDPDTRKMPVVVLSVSDDRDRARRGRRRRLPAEADRRRAAARDASRACSPSAASRGRRSCWSTTIRASA